MDFGNGNNLDNLLLAHIPYTRNAIGQCFAGSRAAFNDIVSRDVWGGSPPAWHLMCLTVQERTLTVFNEATPSAFELTQALPVVLRARSYLARSHYDNDCLFVGDLAHLRLFKRTLSPPEVAQLSAGRATAPPPRSRSPAPPPVRRAWPSCATLMG